jgi:hypothetical protein
MLIRDDIAKLFAAWEKEGVVNRQGYTQDSYFNELRDLDLESLREGFVMQRRAGFVVILFPQDFKRLCNGSWKPASLARRKAAISDIRRSLLMEK